jgi:hypothetical protein
LKLIYRFEATAGHPQGVGEISAGHLRIVPLTGGAFNGPELFGTLVPEASADWQIIVADDTALIDVRYTLDTERGDLLYVQSHGVRHGSPEILERLGRGEDVDTAEYTFRTSAKIGTGAANPDSLDNGIFISVAGPQTGGALYEGYLLG